MARHYRRCPLLGVQGLCQGPVSKYYIHYYLKTRKLNTVKTGVTLNSLKLGMDYPTGTIEICLWL